MTATVAPGLVAVFVLSGPARRGQFGACLGNDGRFLSALDGGTITPVQQPRHDASGTDGDGCNGTQQREGEKGLGHARILISTRTPEGAACISRPGKWCQSRSQRW